MKGIKREFSVPKTPQQNGIAERKNKTLIEAARTMLADSLLPVLFWAESVNTTCYVQNRVLVTKPQNKTPYELLHDRTPNISFMRPFGCPVTILNTIDSLGKFDGKVDEGFLVGYSVSSKAFRVFNSRTRIVQDTLHNTDGDATFDENELEFEGRKPESEVNVSPSSSTKSKKHDDKTKREAKGKSHVKSLTRYKNLSAEFEDFSNNIINEDNAAGTLVPSVGQLSPNNTNTFSATESKDITYSDNEDDVGTEADFNNLEITITVSPIPTTRVHKDHPVTQIIGDLSSATQTRSMTRVAKDQEEPKRVHLALKDPSWIEAMQEELLQFKMQRFRSWLICHMEKELLQTVVSTSSTEAEYVAAASCCAQVLWIQNQLLDYRHILLDCIFLGFGLTMQAVLSGVNTPRSDEDSLELMELTVFLLPSDEKVGIETSVAVKKVNDVTRLQALVDKKKVIITEATIRDALYLDDAEGIECLPNEEIFIELARMGYEKPSTKLTLYKAFFSSRKFNLSKYIFDSLVRNVDSPTKFYMYPHFLQLMIKKQVGDLSIYTTKYSSPALTQKVFANMRRVGKGFSGVETPFFKGMIVEQQVNEGADEMHDEDVPTASVDVEGDVSAADDVVPTAVEEPSIPSSTPPTPPPQPSQDQPSNSQDKIAQALEITKLKQRVKKLGRRNKASKLKTLKKGRIIADMDADDDVTLKDIAAVAKDGQDAEMEETAAPTITTAPSAARRRKGVVIRDPKESSTPSTIIHSEAKSKYKGKGIFVEEPKPLKKQAQIEQDEAYARELEAKLNKNIDWDEVIDHMQRKQKEDNVVKRYQALKRKPQIEAQARKNMMIYLRNVDGFKMDYFKGMTYDDIRPIFEKHFNSNVAFLQKTKEQMDEEDSRALKRLNESQEDKTAKKQNWMRRLKSSRDIFR
nr:retrovirus-related Pol polyprotein from transposon TNT 1-94 [Tanacetum cinerariifolium]